MIETLTFDDELTKTVDLAQQKELENAKELTDFLNLLMSDCMEWARSR